MQSHGQQFVWLSTVGMRKGLEGRPTVVNVYFALEEGK